MDGSVSKEETTWRKNNYGINEGLAYGADLIVGCTNLCLSEEINLSVPVQTWNLLFWFLFGQNHDTISWCQKGQNIWQFALYVALSLSDFSRDAVLLVNKRTSQYQRLFTSFISKYWRYTYSLCENRPQPHGYLTALHFCIQRIA